MVQKETLLRLLLLNDALETSDAWAAVLHGIKDGENPKGLEGGDDAVHESLTLVEAIDAVVPYLPDYSAMARRSSR
ncbi:hypothetical protein BBJ29_009172 [Phytophthora kernoviae]|uniref:Uncharacterized protein n=1 Tax=Phytophthora kernoviae TaxID=325452 RepID=A0A3F2S247_9STRA|nr:hypothetical protein BBJ29_009172 [Phytophthora kernoviae]RLN68718.1 hypothetical protein BBP00_00000848 [Phytophthora kernoviae]